MMRLTSVALISRQSVKIHITRVWTLLQGITHQRREYASSDANPHVDAVFSLQVARAQFSGYAAGAGFQVLFIALQSTFWHRIPK